jgi:hypothetical protein
MRAEDLNPCSLVVRDLLRHRNLAMTGRYVNRSDRSSSDVQRPGTGMTSEPAAAK